MEKIETVACAVFAAAVACVQIVQFFVWITSA